MSSNSGISSGISDVSTIVVLLMVMASLSIVQGFSSSSSTSSYSSSLSIITTKGHPRQFNPDHRHCPGYHCCARCPGGVDYEYNSHTSATTSTTTTTTTTLSAVQSDDLTDYDRKVPSSLRRRTFLRFGGYLSAAIVGVVTTNRPSVVVAADVVGDDASTSINTELVDVSTSTPVTATTTSSNSNNNNANTPKRNVRYVLDETTGEYVEVEDPTWQEAWRGRWNEASNMSTDQIFEAARGAGNIDKKALGDDESPASKKRRALSACRNADVRSRVVGSSNAMNERECTARVLKDGEVDFILSVL